MQIQKVKNPSILHEHVRAMEELAKEKHVFQEALQWSAVLLNRTKARIKPLFLVK